MSGPKLSAAELERARQEQLERERLEALRRLQNARNTWKEASDKLIQARAGAQHTLETMDPVYADVVRKELNGICGKLVIRDVGISSDPADYLLAAEEMNRIAKEYVPALEKCLKKYTSLEGIQKNMSSSDAEHQSFREFLEQKTDPTEIRFLDFRSSYDSELLKSQASDLLQHFRRQTTRGEDRKLREFSEKCIRQLTAPGFLEADDIRDILQNMVNEEAELCRQLEERRVLYESYTALCCILKQSPKPPEDFASAQQFRQELSGLRERYRRKDEMDYIADQINDAMLSLGYDMVTSTVLTRNDQKEMDCSLYQADPSTGIAVYTDEDGSVMMRMTVLGADGRITDEDRDFSLQRQIDFCAGHPDIVEALKRRGVFLRQKCYRAPDRKYTYKANLGDAYGRTGQGHEEKIDRRKRRRGQKKKMYAV